MKFKEYEKKNIFYILKKWRENVVAKVVDAVNTDACPNILKVECPEI